MFIIRTEYVERDLLDSNGWIEWDGGCAEDVNSVVL